MTDPTDPQPLCEDPTCPAYGQPHGPDHDACVDAAEAVGAAELRRLLADLTSPDDRVRFAAATQLTDTLPGWLPVLLDELDTLQARIVTVDIGGRTVRYDEVAECDAALATAEQRLEATERDRDAAQAAAYRLILERDNAVVARDRLVDAVLDQAGPEWRPTVPGARAGEAIAVRYVRHLEATVAQVVPPLTTAGVARLLGVSRPRVVQLRAQDGFPPPDDVRDGRSFWHEHTIRRWAASVGRSTTLTSDDAGKPQLAGQAARPGLPTTDAGGRSTTPTRGDAGEPQDTAHAARPAEGFPTTDAVLADLAAIETGQVTDPDTIRTSVGIARLSLEGWRSAWQVTAAPYLRPIPDRARVRAAIDGANSYDDATDRVMDLLVAVSVAGSGSPGAPAGDRGPGMPHTSSGDPSGPQGPVQPPSRPVTYEGLLGVYQPPSGAPYPVLSLTGGSGTLVVYRPDAVVRVTSELHRDGELLVRSYLGDPPAPGQAT